MNLGEIAEKKRRYSLCALVYVSFFTTLVGKLVIIIWGEFPTSLRSLNLLLDRAHCNAKSSDHFRAPALATANPFFDASCISRSIVAHWALYILTSAAFDIGNICRSLTN